jgi:hypothetical protein
MEVTMGGAIILHGDLAADTDEKLFARQVKANKRLAELEREAQRLAREMETAIYDVKALNEEITRRIREGKAERGE